MIAQNKINLKSIFYLKISISFLIGRLLLELFYYFFNVKNIDLITVVIAVVIIPYLVLFYSQRYFSSFVSLTYSILAFIVVSLFLRGYPEAIMIGGVIMAFQVYDFVLISLEEHLKYHMIKKWEIVISLLLISSSCFINNYIPFFKTSWGIGFYVLLTLIAFVKCGYSNIGLFCFRSNTIEIREKHTLKKIIFKPFYRILHSQKGVLFVIRGIVLTLFFVQCNIHFDKKTNEILTFIFIVLLCVVLFSILFRYFLYHTIIDKYGKLTVLYMTGIIVCLFSVFSLSIHYLFDDQHKPFMGVPSLQMVLTTLLTIIFLINWIVFEASLFDELLETIETSLKVDFRVFTFSLSSILSLLVFKISIDYFWNFDKYHELLYLPLLLFGILHICYHFILRKSYNKTLYDDDKISEYTLDFYPILRLLKDSKINSITIKEFNLLEDLTPISVLSHLKILLQNKDYEVQKLVLEMIIKYGRIDLLEEIKKLARNKKAYLQPNFKLYLKADDILHHIEARLSNSKYVYQLSHSQLSEERLLGAQLCRFLRKEEAEKLLFKLLEDQFIEVRIAAIDTCIHLKVSEEGQAFFIKQLKDPYINNALIDAIYLSDENYWKQINLVFNGVDLSGKSKLRILQLAGLTDSKDSIHFLKVVSSNSDKKLSDTAVDILSLLKEGNVNRTFLIEDQILEMSRQIVWNYMALGVLNNLEQDVDLLIEAIQIDNKYLLEKIIDHCSLLFNYSDIQRIKITLRNNKDFGIQLIDALIPNTLLVKPILILFLKDQNHMQVMKDLYDQWPVEVENFDEVLMKILLNERRFVSNWTRFNAIEKIKISQQNFLKEALFTLLQSSESLLQDMALYGLNKNMDSIVFKQHCKRLGIRFSEKKIRKIILLKSLSENTYFKNLQKEDLLSFLENFTIVEDFDEVFDYQDVPFVYILEGSLSLSIQTEKGNIKQILNTGEYFLRYNSNLNKQSIIEVQSNGIVAIIPSIILSSLIGHTPNIYSFVREHLKPMINEHAL